MTGTNRKILDAVRIVLVGTQHPGNIGSAARAMKTMGLRDLCLVSPQKFPHAEAEAMASNALDILQTATVVNDLKTALADCHYAVGTTARARDIGVPEFSARELALQCERRVAQGKIAIVFGRERTGLENEELGLCHAALKIPTNPDYSSLNLAMAVQIVAYELWLAENSAIGSAQKDVREVANHQSIEGMFAHLARIMDQVDFHKGRPPEHALQRFRRLFMRSELDEREVKMLRGLFTEVERRWQTGDNQP
jgi:tRNA (cytidine32/uridine32-2'-O)-methyltransferase